MSSETSKSITLLPQPLLQVFVNDRLLATCDHTSHWSLRCSGAMMLATIQPNGTLHIAADSVELVAA